MFAGKISRGRHDCGQQSQLVHPDVEVRTGSDFQFRIPYPCLTLRRGRIDWWHFRLWKLLRCPPVSKLLPLLPLRLQVHVCFCLFTFLASQMSKFWSIFIQGKIKNSRWGNIIIMVLPRKPTILPLVTEIYGLLLQYKLQAWAPIKISLIFQRKRKAFGWKQRVFCVCLSARIKILVNPPAARRRFSKVLLIVLPWDLRGLSLFATLESTLK